MKHLIDFHSHHPSRQGERVIQQDIDSWGIHPWNADTSTLPPHFPNDLPYMAIGECGIDKLCGVELSTQINVFRQHILWSEELCKPLILHCVKAIDEMILLRRESKATQPWIFHGFRGKPQQMRSLLSFGFYISFGFQHNIQSLLTCPLENLLMETDEDKRSINLLYTETATLRGIPFNQLTTQMEENFQRLFRSSLS